MSYLDEVIADAPIAWWRMDELTGATIVEDYGSGTAADMTVNFGFSNPPLFEQAGIDGGTAMYFDGANAQYLNVATTPSKLQLTTYTLEAWVRLDVGSTSMGTIFAERTGEGDVRYALGGYSPATVTETLKPMFGQAVFFNTWQYSRSPDDLTLDTWHHVVGTHTGSALELFVDGVSVATNASVGAPPSGVLALQIGRRWDNASFEYFKGGLCHLALYAGVLAAGRILVHYEAGAGIVPAEPPPVVEVPTASQLPPGDRRSGSWEDGGITQRPTAIQERSGSRVRGGVGGTVGAFIRQEEVDVARVRMWGEHVGTLTTGQLPGDENDFTNRRPRVGKGSTGKYTSGEYVLSTASLTGHDPLRIHDKGDPDVFSIRATPGGDLEIAGNLTLTQGGFIRSGVTGYVAEMSAGEFPFRLYQTGSPGTYAAQDSDEGVVTSGASTITSSLAAPPTVGRTLIAAVAYVWDTAGSTPLVQTPDTGWTYSAFTQEQGLMVRIAYKTVDNATNDQTIAWGSFPYTGSSYPVASSLLEVDFGGETPALDRIASDVEIVTVDTATLADPDAVSNFSTSFQLAIIAAAGQMADEYQRFEGGTDGATVATGTPAASPTTGMPFDTSSDAGGTITYEDAAPLFGTMSVKVTRNATTGQLYRGYTLPAGVRSITTREYVMFPTLPTSGGGPAPAPDFQNTFDGGVSGNNIVAGETHSGTPFSTVTKGAGNTVTYDVLTVKHGLASMAVNTSGTQHAYVAFADTGTEGFARCYVRLDALPPTSFATPILFINSGAIVASARITAGGKFSIGNADSTQVALSTMNAPVDTWIRLELHVECNTALGADDGTIHLKIYASDPESITPDEEIYATPTDVNTQFTHVRFGHQGQTSVWSGWFDTVAYQQSDWCGPFIEPGGDFIEFSGIQGQTVAWGIYQGWPAMRMPFETPSAISNWDPAYTFQPNTLYRVEMEMRMTTGGPTSPHTVRVRWYEGNSTTPLITLTNVHLISPTDITDVRFGMTNHAENGWFYYLDEVAYNADTATATYPVSPHPTHAPMSTTTPGWTLVNAQNLDRGFQLGPTAATELRYGVFRNNDEGANPMSLQASLGPSDRVYAAFISFGGGDVRFQVDDAGNIEAEQLTVRSRSAGAAALVARAQHAAALAIEAKNPSDLRTFAVHNSGDLQFVDRVTDPATSAGSAMLYAKNSEATTRLFRKNSDGGLMRVGFGEMEAGPLAHSAIANTSVETELIAHTLPAIPGVGPTLNNESPLWRIFVSGFISHQATSGTLAFRLKHTSTAPAPVDLCTVTIATQAGAAVDLPFWLEAYVFWEETADAEGLAGSMFLRQSMSSAVASATGVSGMGLGFPTLAKISVTAKWATASAANIVSKRIAFIERLR